MRKHDYQTIVPKVSGRVESKGNTAGCFHKNIAVSNSGNKFCKDCLKDMRLEQRAE